MRINTRRYHPLVVDDLNAATRYYDAISHELGNRFRAAVRDALQVITDRPESFARIHGERRLAMTGRFPYVILFEYTEPTVVVVRIVHASSDPQEWATT